MTDQPPDNTMELIVNEITAVSHLLESMNSNISAQRTETTSIHLDISGFQIRETDLETRITSAEDCLNTLQDRDQALLFLCSKIIDIEDRSHRDNVHFSCFPECLEGSDTKHSLKDILPTLTFDPQLELQQAHLIDPVHQDHAERPTA
ncbi:hypothetical protein NDU88_008550 [Pleurodeles waltl]|uniref:Uncharacterized protein n=1 Tax=Pleurodeles waltl TaxID=8319 RepID=A0AAV7QQ15_PLEWA|nr:hypothetical protein NDU88_008550 [Pleurodeles waltl]